MHSNTDSEAAGLPSSDTKRLTTPIHYRPHTDPTSSHQQIVSHVRALAARGLASPLLDVGAAQGMLGHQVSDLKLEMDAIEPHAGWADLARPHYRNVFVTTVEDAPLAGKHYRTIVCGDVLEHLADPVATLKRLRDAATDDARFIISLPNVAHLAIRLMLLFGRFPKMEKGILDRTHLQFLTKDTAIDMLHAAGLEVEQASVTGVPIDEIRRRGQGGFVNRTLMRTQHIALKLLPRVFGYQWIFLARARLG